MRRHFWSCAHAALFAALGWALVACPTARCAEPAAAPPATLARYFPRQDLVAYAEFDGLDAHAGLWKKTAAYHLLTGTATGAMLEDVITQFASRALSSLSCSVDELRAVAGHAARSGFAVGVVRKPGDAKPGCLGVVLRGGGRGEVRGWVETHLSAARGPDVKPQTVDRPRGRKLVVEGGPAPQSGWSWWREGDDLAFSVSAPEGADLMMDALDGRTPDAAGHPARVALARSEGGFTPVGLAFVERAALQHLPPQYAAYGFDQFTRIDCRWGFHGEALMTVTSLAAPAPRSGLLALFDQPTFDRKGLAALPPGLTGFTAFSVDPATLYDRVAAGFANTDPATRARFEAFEKSFRALTGQRLRDDVLTHLGPRVTCYSPPSLVDAPAHVLAGLAMGLFSTPGMAAVIEVRDVKAFSKILSDAMTRAEESLKAQADIGALPPPVKVHKLEGFEVGYTLSISPTAVPLPAGTKPTVILGKKSLVIGSTPDVARRTLALEDKLGGPPGGDALDASLGRLPGGMVFAHVRDDRRSLLPELIANLPGLVQWYATTATRVGFWRLFGRNVQRVPLRGAAAVLNIDPDHVPAPAEIRPFLFPSEFAFTSDEQGLRFTSREAFPAFNPVAVAPVAAAMLVPAYQAQLAAARRSQSVNNLRQIGLALHNFHSTTNHFPPAAIADRNGKPLLSWRVAILPYIEQGPLYNEFKLDEPWDSPHNKPLLARMPPTYAIPGARAGPGMTFYRGFSGEHTLFDPKVKGGVGMQNVLDGTSNTIGIVEARTAVPWTRPDQEIPFDAAIPPEKLKDLLQTVGGHSPGGFNALMLDGSVRFIKETVAFVVLKALITRDAGEVISADMY